jgi:catechol 2,3-dioxygenase-like lactoylglutathione lyase family enzyme
MPATLGAVGIGVADMNRSVHFYTKVLPLSISVTQTIDVAPFLEKILALPTFKSASGKTTSPGSQIILMQYKDGRVPKNQQGKLVFFVDDVGECMRRCKEYGSKVFLEVGAGIDAFSKTIGMVLDPDGFLVEFIPVGTMINTSASPKQGAESKM